MAADLGTDEEILYSPPLGIEINGETIEVLELTYGQSMRLSAALEPLIGAMAEALDLDDPGKGIEMIMARHPESWAALICAATGKPPEWLDTLTDEQGVALQARAWSCNSGFFARRLIAGRAISQAVKLAGSQTQSSH